MGRQRSTWQWLNQDNQIMKCQDVRTYSSIRLRTHWRTSWTGTPAIREGNGREADALRDSPGSSVTIPAPTKGGEITVNMHTQAFGKTARPNADRAIRFRTHPPPFPPSPWSTPTSVAPELSNLWMIQHVLLSTDSVSRPQVLSGSLGWLPEQNEKPTVGNRSSIKSILSIEPCANRGPAIW
ncbi:hypothetical protein VTI28DRAFT_1372 [Corynascus sepedonium]